MQDESCLLTVRPLGASTDSNCKLLIMEAPGRVELPTNGLGNRCSIHLSYGAHYSDLLLPVYNADVRRLVTLPLEPGESGVDLPGACDANAVGYATRECPVN